MAKSWNVLVTARAFHDSGIDAWKSLEVAGCKITISDRWGPLTEASLIQQLQNMDAVIAATDPYNPAVFARCPDLKLVARCGVGIDSVSLPAATDAGVVVTNVPDAMTDAVADYCFALLLSGIRRICEGLQCMQEGGWTELRGFELAGKILGLVGFGKIGQAVMRRAIGFGMKVIAYDPYYSNAARASLFPNVEFVDLDDVFRRSRVVSIHAPNQPDTVHLVNARRLAMMNPDAWLINTSRGKLIDETALMEALHTGKIAAAAIDVYQQEPLPADHRLRKTPRLLLTPHNAFNSIEAAIRMSDGCAQPILDILAGRSLQNVCNPEVLAQSNLKISRQN
ncbi:MAG: phosphoglycerate dehydrogenase [Planctomycetaceae bacterium]